MIKRLFTKSVSPTYVLALVVVMDLPEEFREVVPWYVALPFVVVLFSVILCLEEQFNG